MTVSRCSLSPSGPEVSRIVYGVWRLNEDSAGASPARVRAKIDACLERGITTFDHADIYGGYANEGLFGAALRECPALRDRMEIVTKTGICLVTPARPQYMVKHYAATAEHMAASVENSLRQLGTDRIDLLLVHRPDWLTEADETALTLNALVRSGKVRHIGVSNYLTHQFELLASRLRTPLATNQVELSLLRMQAITDGTLNQCEQRRIRPMAWSPLGGGRLFTSDEEGMRRLRAELAAVGEELGGAAAEQVALAWVLALPSRPVVVVGTNQIERIALAAGADSLRLTRQQWYRLWSAARGEPVP